MTATSSAGGAMELTGIHHLTAISAAIGDNDRAQNEPWLGSALGVVAGLVEDLARQGIPAGRVAVMGFSQGACLALEFAARHPRRYAAVVVFTGGLIGPPGHPRDYTGDFSESAVRAEGVSRWQISRSDISSAASPRRRSIGGSRAHW